MSLADLKKDLKSKNKKKLEDKGYTSTKDERFYTPSVDENGKVNVKARLLPSYVKDEDGQPVSLESFVSVNYHSISDCGKDKRWYAKTLCRKTIGEKCAICDHGSEMFSNLKEDGMSKSDAGKKAGKWWSDGKFITNILILEDKENPDNVGKTFLFEINKQIMNNIKAQMSPDDYETDFIDERDLFIIDDEVQAFDAWDLDESFVIHLSRTAGEKDPSGKKWKEFPSWGKSRLLVEKGPEELAEDEQEKLIESTYDLSEFKDEKNYPTYEETVKTINFLTYVTDSKDDDAGADAKDEKQKELSESEEDEEEKPKKTATSKEDRKKKKVDPEPEPEPDDKDDADLLADIDDLID